MKGIALLAVLAFGLLPVTDAAAAICDEQVTIAAGPGSIEVYHSQAEYNCCAWIDTDVQTVGYGIDIFEREQLEAPCDCMCCFDIIVELAGLAAGEYTLRIYKNSECTGGEDVLYGTWTVVVEGSSEPLVRATYIPCVETGAPADIGTWSTIKALYR